MQLFTSSPSQVMGFKYQPILFIPYILVTCLYSSLEAFNIDTKNVRVITGTEGSHFGYTIHFDTKTIGENRGNLLVGAPKSKMTIDQEKYDSGSVFTCFDVLGQTENCTEILLQNRFPVFVADKKSFVDEGYGSALSVSADGDILICAPYWKDRRYTMGRNYTFMPGRCVGSLQTQGFERDFLPYFGTNYIKQQEYFYGLAAFGVSSDVYENSVFAIGSPGLNIFEGGITVIDCTTELVKSFQTTKEYRNSLNTTAYGYLGYEIKFGEFCNSPSVCFAAGAPQLYTVGGIRLYLWAYRENLVNFQTIQGEKAWSYFGSVLCAVDTDDDGIDELIVGAPYYSDSNDQLDIGKVYVYRRNSISKYFYLHQKLDGGRVKYGRFGSAIQGVGDINLDGHLDIAVGAPGEEDGSGCIYIYLGSADGLSNDIYQRICAKDITGVKFPLKGFGSAFSGPSQSHQNPYPAFAVGAYESDSLVLLYSRSVLEVTATLTAIPNPVDINDPCIHTTNDGPCTIVQFCLHHKIREQAEPNKSPKEYNFTITMNINTRMERTKRASFLSKDGQLIETVQRSELVNPLGVCSHTIVVIPKKQVATDRFNPIQIEMSYELTSDDQDRNAPILDPLAENNIYDRITFANECGSDNICVVDLKVEGHLVYTHVDAGDGPNIIIDFTKEITALITISNNREVCYWTEIKVTVSQPLALSKFTSDKIRECKRVSDSLNRVGTTVVCNYYQPLSMDTNLGLIVTFETANFDLDESKLIISAEAIARDVKYNAETQLKDNKIEVTANVSVMAHVNVLGNALPSEITVSKGKKISLGSYEKIKEGNSSTSETYSTHEVMLNHKVLIKNFGPSFLPKTKVHLNVPIYIPDGTKLVTATSVQLITGDQSTDCYQTSQGSLQTGNTINPSTTTKTIFGDIDGGINRRKREVGEDILEPEKEHIMKNDTVKDKPDEAEQSIVYTLTCDVTPEYCLTFTCNFPKVIQPGGHAELNVSLTLDKDNVPMPEDYTTFQLELKTIVEQPNHKLFKPWNATSIQQAITVTHTSFHLYESGGKINIWIIIGSVLAGLVFLAILILVFWKCGFFERKRHFQVQKWRNESMKSRSSQRRKS